jgi:hypothetical protein
MKDEQQTEYYSVMQSPTSSSYATAQSNLSGNSSRTLTPNSINSPVKSPRKTLDFDSPARQRLERSQSLYQIPEQQDDVIQRISLPDIRDFFSAKVGRFQINRSFLKADSA